jgi:ribosomal protein S18 acetylase RimI-like enzyme
MTGFSIHFSIRPATPRDHDALVAGNAAMAEETEGKALDLTKLRPGVLRALTDASAARYFVAVARNGDDDGAVVGQIMITTEWSDWRNGFFYWIQSVYVVPAWRRRGVYRALHAHVVDDARARADVVGVRLYVEPHNERAQKTYRSLGMHKTYDVMEQET